MFDFIGMQRHAAARLDTELAHSKIRSFVRRDQDRFAYAGCIWDGFGGDVLDVFDAHYSLLE